MSTNFILKVGVALLLVALFFYVWDQSSKSEDEGNEILGKFWVIILGGIAAAFIAGMFIVPLIGDMVGTFIYGSGEKITDTSSNAAAAKLAQGDWQGAIEEYQRMAEEEPGVAHPIWEAAKIRAEKLEDPDGALDYLKEQIGAQKWDEDNGAFLLFRVADLHEEYQGDADAAIDVLRQVVGTFTGTRHAANATSKIRKLEQGLIEEQRPKVDPQLPG